MPKDEQRVPRQEGESYEIVDARLRRSGSQSSLPYVSCQNLCKKESKLISGELSSF